MSFRSSHVLAIVFAIGISWAVFSLTGCDSNTLTNSESNADQSRTPELTPSSEEGGDEASFQSLGSLPGGQFRSVALGVSPDGSVVVGRSSSSNGSREAFRWTENEGMVGLGDLPGGNFNSSATATSNSDAAIIGVCDGRDSEPPPPIPEFWLVDSNTCWWKSGELLNTREFYPDAYSMNALANNFFVGARTSPYGTLEATRWYYDGTDVVGLGSLPGGIYASLATATSTDASVVVGHSSSGSSGPNGAEAFRWTESNGMVGLGDLSGGGFHSRAYDVSADGSVAVGMSHSAESGDLFEAFRWKNGTMVGLGSLPDPDFESRAYGVSADGSVIVGESGASHPSFYDTAFIWTPENGMQDLKEVLENDYNLDLSGWTLHNAADISDDGKVIVGRGNKNGNSVGWRAFLGEPLPPPPPCDPFCEPK